MRRGEHPPRRDQRPAAVLLLKIRAHGRLEQERDHERVLPEVGGLAADDARVWSRGGRDRLNKRAEEQDQRCDGCDDGPPAAGAWV